MIYYATTNLDRKEPEVIKTTDYINVKSKADGSQTVIITKEEIVDSNLVQLTFDEAQSLLDSWIDEENAQPIEYDIAGAEIRQSYIPLGAFNG